MNGDGLYRTSVNPKWRFYLEFTLLKRDERNGGGIRSNTEL